MLLILRGGCGDKRGRVLLVGETVAVGNALS